MKTAPRTRRALAWLSYGSLALVVLLLAPPATAAEEGMTPEHIAKLQSVGDAVVAPDGKHVAYLLSVPRPPLDPEDGPAWAELHVLDVASGESRPYVTGEVSVSHIHWTPGGDAIGYLAKRGDDEHPSLYAIPLRGGESRQLVAYDSGISEFSFAPDGAHVAFVATVPKSEERKEQEKKGFDQEIYEEDVPHARLLMAKVDLTAREPVEPTELAVDGSVSMVRWSPRGDRLALAVAPTPLTDDRYMRRVIQIVDAKSGDVLGKVDTEGKLADVRWSPDGKHLAIIGPADIHDPAAGRLLVASLEGGEAPDLLPGFEGHVRNVAWIDDDTIVCVADEGVWTTVNTIDVDSGARIVRVEAGGPVLSKLSVSRDGKHMAFLGSSPEHPAEVFYVGPRVREPKRLTDNNPWLSEVRLAKQEVVKYAARDGLELEGILFRPLDEEPGQQVPLVLAVHGGPESHRRNEWLTSYSRPSQTLAAQGFAVFFPNYRGSTGRGVEFSKLSQGDPAGKEFDDVVDAIDHFVAAGLVDKDRVGITGGSYGGYASAWGATYYTERFAASVMFVGISDNIAKFGTTDIADESLLVHQRRRVWEDWDFFRERSPIYHAGKSRTPTLILHGKKDPRVHHGQSLALYRHLKVHGKTPVRLVLYPGEKHGNRKAAARYDYCLRIMRWMKHYLQGPGGDMPDYELEYAPAGEPAEEPVAASAK